MSRNSTAIHWINAFSKLVLSSVLYIVLFLLQRRHIYCTHYISFHLWEIFTLRSTQEGVTAFSLRWYYNPKNISYLLLLSLTSPPANPPVSIFLVTEQRQQNPGSTILSVMPFPIPGWGSVTRESVITDAALSLPHHGTISYFKLVPFIILEEPCPSGYWATVHTPSALPTAFSEYAFQTLWLLL